MTGRLFVDTNILVYAVDFNDPKSETARSLLKGDEICLSTQVLHEFYVAVTRARRASPHTHDEAVAWVQLWKNFDVHPITVDHTDLAIEIKARFQLSFYDALIVASAHLAGCRTLITEDLNSGQDYGGVRVRNPF